jgi:hypothetical protein
MRPTDAEIDAVLQAVREAPGTTPISIGPNCSAHWSFIYAIEWASGREPTGEWIPEWAARMTKAADAVRVEKEEEFRQWETENDRLGRLWDAWERDHPLETAIPSVPYGPDEVARYGRCVFTAVGDDGESYISPLLNDPTWGDVVRAFDEAIPVVDNYHHVFLEGVRLDNVVSGTVDDTAVFTFITGS